MKIDSSRPLAPAAPTTVAASAPVAARAAEATDAFAPTAHTGSAQPGNVLSGFVPNTAFSFDAQAAEPDGFQISLSGHYPPSAAGGFFEKLSQAEKTTALSLDANQSISSGGKSPSDDEVKAKLAGLHELPLKPGSPVSEADYTSTIPRCEPWKAMLAMINHPGEAFAAGGMNVRPKTFALEDGQRLMIESKGTPNMWMPVSVKLDWKTNTITFNTLDGHPFRGSNAFTFEDNGQGGVTVKQKSLFQGSSDLIHTMGQGGLDRQHASWKGVHGYLFDQLANTAGQL